MKRRLKIVLQVLPYVFFFIAVALILQIVSSVANDRAPSVFGISVFIVLTPSMEDTIMVGDLIFVKQVDSNTLEEQDIITFVKPNGQGELITHRIIKIQTIDGKLAFTTRGDANFATFDWETDFSDEAIVGKYIGKSAFLGNLYQTIFSGGINYIYAIAILIFLLIAFSEAMNLIREYNNYKKKQFLEEKQSMVDAEMKRLLEEQQDQKNQEK
jgi:signal peptidase